MTSRSWGDLSMAGGMKASVPGLDIYSYVMLDFIVLTNRDIIVGGRGTGGEIRDGSRLSFADGCRRLDGLKINSNSYQLTVINSGKGIVLNQGADGADAFQSRNLPWQHQLKRRSRQFSVRQLGW